MTQRHILDEHHRKLNELGDIMHAMKTLAIMETHKVAKVLTAQLAMTASIETTARDFLHYYPQVLPEQGPVAHILLLVGSERGFCGSFNQQLITKLTQSKIDLAASNLTIIACGSKLHPLLQDYQDRCLFAAGMDTGDEIIKVAQTLTQMLAGCVQPASLTVLYHSSQSNDIISHQLLPPVWLLDDDKVAHDKVVDLNPPLLNVTAQALFLDLSEHYLFSMLRQLLYSSLMTENQQRIAHLEMATHHLDDKTAALKLKINTQRQEEIIEEIEVILLNGKASPK